MLIATNHSARNAGTNANRSMIELSKMTKQSLPTNAGKEAVFVLKSIENTIASACRQTLQFPHVNLTHYASTPASSSGSNHKADIMTMTSALATNTQMGGTYPYQPLTEHDSIRLILLQPAPSEDAKVRCSLIHTTLSECACDIVEHYIALSYVWGNVTSVRTIWIDELPVSVTRNLYLALLDL
jgi:hypothetical protein